MNKKEKIDAIYKAMANKTPSYRCRARIYCTNDSTLADNDFAGGDQYIDVVYNQQCKHTHKQDLVYKDMIFKFLLYDQRGDIALDPFITRGYKHRFLCIIGHPVMIGDVMEYIDNIELNEENWRFKYGQLFIARGDKSRSLDEQSDRCIDYVYSLIQQ